eukprot:g9927.t1
MQGAGDSDGGGLDKSKAPTKDKAVELRKSCDYCVRLKRACDGKNPCSLCSRRNKPCTRSARKKSGPAKGTKYAPRRKRSVIAEWADHASLGREASLPHDFPGGGGMGGGGGAGGQLHHNLPLPPGEAGAAAAYLGGGGPPSSLHPPPARRYGGEAAWSSDPLASTLSRHPQGRGPTDLGRPPPPSMPSHSSALPYAAAWYGSVPGHEGAEAGGAGGPEDYRQLGHRFEPTMGYAPTTAEMLSRRQEHHAQDPRGAWSMSPMEAEGAREGGRSAAEMDPQRRRTWEPAPGSWTGHSEPLVRSPQGAVGLSHGQRVRLSPPSLSARPLMRPSADPYASAAPSPREREAAGRAAEQPRGVDPESSLPFLPAREPPDPTAGFSFRPAANRSTWRRASHSWESPGGGDGGGGGGGAGAGGGGRALDRNDPGIQQHYAQQHPAYFDAVERPRSAWNSPGGGVGDYPEGRRYRDDFRGEERGQDRGVVEWHLPHGERGESFRERADLPPPPHAFERRHQPVERPLAGGGGGGGGEVLMGAPPLAGPGPAQRDDREQRQEMFARGGGGPESPYERSVGRHGWPGDQLDAQQRGQPGAGPAPGRQDWEEPRRGPTGGGGGDGRRGVFPYQWESERGEPFASAFDPSAQQDPRWRGGENSRVALPPSSSSAFEAGRVSSRQEEGEEGGGRSSPTASPAAAAAVARGGGGHGQGDEQGPQEMEEEMDSRHRSAGREQTGEGREPAHARSPASGDHPAA